MRAVAIASFVLLSLPLPLSAQEILPEQDPRAGVEAKMALVQHRDAGILGIDELSPEVRANLEQAPFFPDLLPPTQGPTVRVNDLAGQVANEVQSNPSVAAHGSNVVVCWFDTRYFAEAFPYTNKGLRYAYSCDYGQTWTDGGTPTLDDPNDFVHFGMLAVNETGEFYLTANYLGYDSSLNFDLDATAVWKGSFTGCSFAWNSPVIVSQFYDPSGYMWWPHIDVSGNFVVVAHAVALGTGGENVEVAYSTDGGQTWTDHVVLWESLPTNQRFPGYPRVAVGADGDAYVAWVSERRFGYWCDFHSVAPRVVYFSRTTDSGATWSAATNIASYQQHAGGVGPDDWRGFDFSAMDIAVDRSDTPNRGNVYLTWSQTGAWGPGTLGGSTIAEVEDNGIPGSALTLQVGDTGTGNINDGEIDYWKVFLQAGDEVVIRTTPGGNVCGTAITQSMRTYFYAEDVDASSTPDSLMAYSNVGSWVNEIVFKATRTGTYIARLYQGSGGASPYRIEVASVDIGPSGSNPARDQGDVVAIASTDQGLTWSSPRLLNDDVPEGYMEKFPAVAVGNDGVARFFWMDRRETEGNPTVNTSHLTDIYSRTTADALVTLGTPIRITDESTRLGGPVLTSVNLQYWATDVASDGGHFLPVWADARASNHATSYYDIYSNFLDFEPPTTAFTLAPAESSVVLTDSVDFAWSGTDRISADSTLTYSVNLDSMGYGPFEPDTASTFVFPAGHHTVAVRAQDEEGNIESTAARNFFVDLAAPAVSVLSGPPEGAHLGADSTSFSWSGTDDNSPPGALEFATSLDGAPLSAFTPSTSLALTGLSAGNHSLEIRCRDEAGRESSITRGFVVDLTPPETVFESTPPPVVSTGEASFAFSGTDDLAAPGELRFSWALDADPFSAPDTATTLDLSGLGDGLHVLEVRAHDLAGNVDGSPASYSWTVDAEAPGLALSAGPGSPGTPASTSSSDVTFSWSAVDAVSGPGDILFFHRLDGGPESGPTADSSASFPGLAEGFHTFDLRAVDESGNESTLSQPFTVDQTPPNTLQASGPGDGGWAQADPVFGWAASDNLSPPEDMSYSTSLDAGTPTPFVNDPTTSLAGLTAGPHTLEVTARDLAGNPDPTPLTLTFTVDLDDPETALLSAPAAGDTVVAADAILSWIGSDASAPVEELTYSWRINGGTYTPPSGLTTDLIPLADGIQAFEVRAHDPAGNVDGSPAAVTFTADLTPPSIAFTEGPAPGAHIGTPDTSFAWSVSDAVSDPVDIETSFRIDADAFSAWNGANAASYSGLFEGLHTFSVRARDLAGRVRTVSRNFRVDLTPPVADTPSASVLDAQQVRFTFSGSDAGTIDSYDYEISEDPTFATTLQTGSTGPNTPVTYQGLQGHTYYARARAYDRAGNEGDYSGPSNGAVVSDLPDLVVASVQAPPSANSGQPVLVSWTVENVGAGSTNQPTWYDRIFLSPTETFDLGTAVLLGEVDNLTYLAAGETYTSEFTADLPLGVFGDYYLFVSTDARDDVPENDGTNNTNGSSAMPITLSAHADLRPTLVTVPLTAFSGTSVNVVWTVENEGDGRTDKDSWHDTIFFSDDPVLDYTLPGTGLLKFTDPPLGSKLHVGALDPGETYQANVNVTLPSSYSGTGYLFVWSDIAVGSVNQTVGDDGSIFENVGQFDNELGDSLSITIAPPSDLRVTSVTGPATASSGQSYSASWTVENAGLAITQASSWTDRVYLSTDDILDGSDPVVRSTGHFGQLAVDGTYDASATFTMPDGTSGTRYVIVKTDTGGQEAELDEANNSGTPVEVAVTLTPAPDLQVADAVSPSSAVAGSQINVSWTTVNATPNPIPGNWTDRVYLSSSSVFAPGATLLSGVTRSPSSVGQVRSATPGLATDLAGTYYLHFVADAGTSVYEHLAEGNNVLTRPINIAPYPDVDLVVTDLLVGGSGASGAPLSVSWTVENQGQATTRASGWTERVYLSTDTVLDGSDLLLSDPGHSGTLTPGSSYTRNISPLVPNTVSGSFFVIVETDPAGVTGDVDLANNRRASGSPESGGNDPIVVAPTPAPDLVVTSVDAPATALAGQPVTVSWTVQNQGAGEPDPSDWVNSVYLSQDPLLDATDLLLDTRPGIAPFGPGSSLDDSVDVLLPGYRSGPHYLLVQTDSQKRVYEGGSESNNLLQTPLVIDLQPPADLVITSITVPPTAFPGQPVTVSWTVENVGTNTATGFMRDVVYLSADGVFVSEEDPVVGTLERTVSVPPGGSLIVSKEILLTEELLAQLAGQLTDNLPGVTPGSYRFLARTNATDNIREVDQANNLSVAGDPTQVDIPAITVGVVESGLMTQGELRYYKVSPTPGVDLTISLSTDAGDATNEMYVAYDRAPTLGDFDFRGPAEFTATPSVLIPSTQAGDYFILLRTAALPLGSTEQSFGLLAQEVPFSITSVTPSRGGTRGRVTTVIRGAGFRTFSQVWLDYTGVRVDPVSVAFVNTTEMRVVWDLAEVPEAVYDVVVNTDGLQQLLRGGFTVEPPLDLAIETELVHPDVVRSNSTGTFTFRYRNTANWNIPYLEGRILFPAGSDLVAVESAGRVVLPSDLLPGTYSPSGGESYEVVNPEYSYPLEVIEFTAHDIAPGEEVTVSVGLRNFVGTPYSVKSIHEPLETGAWMGRIQQRIERARQAVLANPSPYDASVASLANDPAGFRAAALSGTWVAAGLVDQATVDALGAVAVPPDPVAPGDEDGPCLVVDPVVECSPPPGEIGCALPACLTCFETDLPVGLRLPTEISVPVPGGVCEGLTGEACADAKVVASCDPNALTGPAGYGDDRWVPVGQQMPYTVDFENLAEVATAPAQVVTIELPIDTNMDLGSFRLGSMGFGDNVINVPPGTSTYTTQALYPDLGLEVRVVAGIDIANRKAVWTFSSIDPNTGQPPADPNVGFLPANDATGRGQGFANFLIKPSPSASTGTVISGQATIVFDIDNKSFDTNVVTNTVDSGIPSSAVAPSATQVNDTTYDLSWSASDDPAGSGFKEVSLYVREDGGPFVRLAQGLNGSSFTFQGQTGHIYEFYTLARDNSGNQESGKTSGELELPIGNNIGVGDRPRPLPFALHQNAPNPFRSESVIRFDLPEERKVTLVLYDVAGREVATLLEDERMPPGANEIPIDATRIASGVYFYRIQAGPDTGTKKLMILR